MSPRRYFPRHLTYRWFATRGWCLGAAVAFAGAALWLRPLDLPIPVWVLGVAFGDAALAMLFLSWRPESLRFRLWAVAGSVSAALVRSWGLMFGVGQSVTSRAAAVMVWLFIAYACWLMAMFTAKVPNRGR